MTFKAFLPIILLLNVPLAIRTDTEINIKNSIDWYQNEFKNWQMSWERFIAYYHDPYPLNEVQDKHDRFLFRTYTKRANEVGLPTLYEEESGKFLEAVEKAKISLQAYLKKKNKTEHPQQDYFQKMSKFDL